jgi:hypothetical protein
MSLSKKAWEQKLVRATDKILIEARAFKEEEEYLHFVGSEEGNTHYLPLLISVNELDDVYAEYPLKQVPKLDVLTFEM